MATMETEVARTVGAGFGIEVRLDDRTGSGLADQLRYHRSSPTTTHPPRRW